MLTDAAPAGAWITRRGMIAISLLVGVALRLAQYAFNRSLWLDEALMAPSVVNRSAVELLSPASWGPVPPGFLLLTKLSVVLLGNNEYALRLIPFLASIASLFLFLAAARRYLTPGAVPFAVALFALSPFLIYYGSEVKQYSSDVMVALVLLILAHELCRRGVTVRSAMVWAVAGLAGLALSLTAVFVMFGASVALLLRAWKAEDRRGAGLLSAVLGAWIAVLCVPLLALAAGSGGGYMRAFWSSGFMPFPPRSIEELAWFPRTLLRTFRDPLGVISDRQTESGFYQAAAGMLVFGAGLAWMLARRAIYLWLLLAPVLLTLMASALELYPFGGKWTSAGRVILFLCPALFLVMGEGAAQLWRRFAPGMRGLAVAVVLLLILPPVAWAAIAVPSPRNEIKPLLSYLESEHRPGDLLYVHYDARHAFEYYRSKYDLSGTAYIRGPCARLQPQQYVVALNHARGHPRVWVLFSDGLGAKRFDEKGFMTGYLDRVGVRLDDRVAFGASLYLYDLRATAATREPSSIQVPVMPPSVEEGCALWQ